jgi:hypothetical protein
MWQPQLDGGDPVALSAAAAVLFTLLSHYMFSRPSELLSELLCWLLLPILFRVSKRLGVTPSPASTGSLVMNNRPRPASSISLWAFAACLGVVSFYKTEKITIEFFVSRALGIQIYDQFSYAKRLQPVLTPLLVALKNLRLESHVWRSSIFPLFVPLVDTVWGTTLVAFFIIITLTNWDIQAALPSVAPVAALLLAYCSLIPEINDNRRFLPAVDIEIDIIPITWRILVILIGGLYADITIFGLTNAEIMSTVALGITKACSWYFMILTVGKLEERNLS